MCPFTTADENPVCLRPYKINLRDEEALENICDKWIERGIIRENEMSEYASPALLVYKRDEQEKSRMVVNYKAMNKKCSKMSVPVPNIDRLFEKLRGKKYFILIDMANGFLHVKMKESDIHKTAFVTTKRKLEFTRMPFGYKNSPAVFQTAVYGVLKRNRVDYEVVKFVDDLCSEVENEEDLIERAEKLLRVFEKENIKLKLSKCKFGFEKVDFLGHEVSFNELRPKSENVDAVVNYPRPRSKAGCQRLIGKVSYNRKFIKNASDILRPLIEETCESVKRFRWTVGCQKAFEEIKRVLTSAPVLCLYDQSKKCYLFTDASKVGVGSVLKQLQSDGELHPVAYFSRALKDYQKNYCSTELELLAIVLSVDFFHAYLYSKKFTVITDHQALRYLETFKTKNMRLTKWSIELASYEFEVVYRVGKQNFEADALSRAPLDQVYKEEEYQKMINLLTKEEIVEFQKGMKMRDDRERLNDVIVTRDNGRVRVVVEGDEMESELFRRYHKEESHGGEDKMKNRIRKAYDVKRLDKKVQEFARKCETCVKCKTAMRQSLGYLGTLGPAKEPFEVVSIDTKGGFKNLKSTKRYLHLAICHMTRKVWHVTSKSQTEEDMINLVKEILKEGNRKLFCAIATQQ